MKKIKVQYKKLFQDVVFLRGKKPFNLTENAFESCNLIFTLQQ
jgi:hypothetical protein